jgi:hypothetical protein
MVPQLPLPAPPFFSSAFTPLEKILVNYPYTNKPWLQKIHVKIVGSTRPCIRDQAKTVDWFSCRVVDPDPEPDPDPYWIRIQLGLWIRIRIRNPDPDPGGQK